MAKFTKGMTPWNKGKIGICKPNSGSFKPGMIPHNKTEHINKNCLFCGIEFSVKPSLARVNHCSLSCARKNRPSPMAGRKLSQEHKDKISKAHRAWRKKYPNKKRWNESENPTFLMLKKRLRGTIDWVAWRLTIFNRDNYTCQECGNHGVYLEPHHIISLHENINLAYDINNGITLCRPCHEKTIRKEKEFQVKYSILAHNRAQNYFK